MNQTKQTNASIEILKVTKYKKKYIVEITPYDDFLEKETFTEDQMVENRIFKGKLFLISEWQEILNNKNTSDLFDKVINYLSFGLKSKKEVKEYLFNHNAKDEDVIKVIDKLEKHHFIDDEVYAKNFLNKVINNKKGPIYFKNELKSKGIDNFIIENNIINYNEEIINENINYLIDKEINNLKTYPILKQKEKIYQKLLRMGYTNSSINYNLSKVEFSSDHKNRLIKEVESLLNKNIDDKKIIQKLLLKGYSYQEINEVIKEKTNNL